MGGGEDEVVNAEGEIPVRDAPEALLVMRHQLVVDCIAGGGDVPLACRSDEFLDGLRSICKDTGTVIQQVWSPQFDELMPHYEKCFGSVTDRDLSLGVNHLIFASDPQQ